MDGGFLFELAVDTKEGTDKNPKGFRLFLYLLVIASMILSACGTQATPAPATAEPGNVAPVDLPEPTAEPVRNGAWLDTLIFTAIAEQASQRLEARSHAPVATGSGGPSRTINDRSTAGGAS